MTEHRVPDVTIYAIERLRLSANGNPRFRLATSVGIFYAETDASLGYSLENYTNGRFPETFVIGNPDHPRVTLLVTKANKVYGIEYNGKVLH